MKDLLYSETYIQYLAITYNKNNLKSVYMYNWITLLYTWNEYIINELYLNLKNSK